MKLRKDKQGAAGTIIAQGMRVDAKLLSGSGTLRIEGEYHGDISIEGELIVELSGHVIGQVHTTVADISGSVTGDITCTDWLHLKATGQIKGDITCGAILMDEGAMFVGYSNMQERLLPAPGSQELDKIIEGEIS